MGGWGLEGGVHVQLVELCNVQWWELGRQASKASSSQLFVLLILKGGCGQARCHTRFSMHFAGGM